MKVKDYKRPRFPNVRTEIANNLVTAFQRAHDALMSNVNLNPIAIPGYLAREQGPAVALAKTALIGAFAKAQAAARARRDLETKPARLDVDPGAVGALQVAILWARGSDERERELQDRITNPRSPRDLAITKAAIETQVPLWGAMSGPGYDNLRAKLNIPDPIKAEGERLAEQENEARLEIAEIRSVIAEGLRGAARSAMSGFEIEDRAAYLAKHGRSEYEQALSFEASIREVTVTPEEIEPPAKIEQAAEPFTFTPVS